MKHLKTVGAMSLAALLLGCVSMAGCATDKNTDDSSDANKEIPKIAYTIDESLIETAQANDEMFYAKNVERVESPLAGKTLYWLGSSVTDGAASGSESMADFLAAKTGCISKKEAVSGTTIFDDGKSDNTGEKSYTRRLKNSSVFNKTEKVDAFICQISTNDAWGDRKKNWGTIASDDMLYQENFDLSTTLGGIEFIIAYVTDTWNCPIYFYSGAEFLDRDKTLSPRANSNPTGTDYGELVNKVLEIAEKWKKADIDVEVIDLFHDIDFNAKASDAYYSWAMNDPIHPKKAGYLQWWAPYFEQYLLVSLGLY